MSSLAVALVQSRTPATQGAAAEHLTALIDEAAAGGAQLIVTPEASNFLQRKREAFLEQVTDAAADKTVAAARAAAKRHGTHILLGSALVKRPDGLYANRSFLFGPGGDEIATYDKIHMFDVDLPTGERHRESAVYSPGERATVADLPFGKLGLTICYDLRFPHLFRALAKAGAEMIAVPAAFTRPTGEAHWQVLLRARAIETGAFVLAAAQGGFHEDGRGTWGRSVVIGPWGEVIARAEDDEPQIVRAEINLAEVIKARSAIPALTHDRVFAAP